MNKPNDGGESPYNALVHLKDTYDRITQGARRGLYDVCQGVAEQMEKLTDGQWKKMIEHSFWDSRRRPSPKASREKRMRSIFQFVFGAKSDADINRANRAAKVVLKELSKGTHASRLASTLMNRLSVNLRLGRRKKEEKSSHDASSAASGKPKERRNGQSKRATDDGGNANTARKERQERQHDENSANDDEEPKCTRRPERMRIRVPRKLRDDLRAQSPGSYRAVVQLKRDGTWHLRQLRGPV